MERYQRQYQALGSTVLLTLVAQMSPARAEELFERLYKRITTFEKRFSRFLPASELTRFNKQAGKKTPASPAFIRLLTTSKDLAVKTGGLYNPFILPALQQAGYLASWSKADSAKPVIDFTNRHVVEARQLVIGDKWASIPRQTALDFGGIGKGYLLDELARKLDNENLAGYWLSLGGDIILAGCDLNGRPWEVAVQSTAGPGKAVDAVSNPGGQKLAIATSGVTKRQGVKNGKKWHHIIDPRTGKPARTKVLAATVSADLAVDADVYAKCIVIGGPKQAKAYQDKGVIKSFLLQMKGYEDTIEPPKAAKKL